MYSLEVDSFDGRINLPIPKKVHVHDRYTENLSIFEQNTFTHIHAHNVSLDEFLFSPHIQMHCTIKQNREKLKLNCVQLNSIQTPSPSHFFLCKMCVCHNVLWIHINAHIFEIISHLNFTETIQMESILRLFVFSLALCLSLM